MESQLLWLTQLHVPIPSCRRSLQVRMEPHHTHSYIVNDVIMMSLHLYSDDVQLPVSLKDFPDHVRKHHANSDHPFSEEYQVTSCDCNHGNQLSSTIRPITPFSQMITIKSPGLPHVQGSTAVNVMKNRYANINACKYLLHHHFH